MPVIIDEVTAVVDPAPPAPQAGPSTEGTQPAQLDMADLARKIALIAQRKARLVAD